MPGHIPGNRINKPEPKNMDPETWANPKSIYFVEGSMTLASKDMELIKQEVAGIRDF